MKTPCEIEKHMISSDKWEDCPHENAVFIALSESAAGFPTGLANTPDGHWHVFSYTWGGPFIMWSSDPSWKGNKK